MSEETEINNCSWAFRCPQRWDALAPTASASVRHCSECQKYVFFCQTQEEVDYHAKRLHCIKLANVADDGMDWMGRYLPPQYQGATMKILLEPTDSLDQDQVKFLVRAFTLEKPELNWKEILCDGRRHALKTKVPPDIAENLSRRMNDRNIRHKLEVESD